VPAGRPTCNGCGSALTGVPQRDPSVTGFQSADQATGFQAADQATGFQAGTDQATGSLETWDHLASAGGPPAAARRPPTTPAGADSAGSTGPLKPGEAFGSRYHIIRLLGMGGMGAVYQAWDAELGVAVAIKVILPSEDDPTAAAELERRFKRELVLARQVTHKNVVRIHDLGEIDGIKYITMSYIDGADLSTILKREGRLGVAKVLQIARPVVSGLVAAHAAGIVHRDLKPPNIMVDTAGDAVIMDFGIARSTGTPMVDARLLPTGAAGRQHLHLNRTMVGAVIGTVEYMAPEQAKGQAVDQRADIYAFGLMLYDMLAGRHRAETATSALDELKARMVEAPASLRTLVPDIPEPFDRIISRCILPNPADRYQTTGDLEAELNRLDENGELIPIKRVVGMRILAAVVTIAFALLGGSWWYAQTLIPPAQHEPVSVIIADFQNNTSDPTFDRTIEPTLRRGIEDATFVSAYDRGRIRSTFGIQPPDKLDEVAARELAVKQGLGVVVSGSIDTRGNGYEISVKAIQTVTGNEITSATRRASSKEQVPDVVTRLVTTVRTALGDETSDSDQLFAMRSVSATSLGVVQHYAAAVEAQSNGRYEETRQSALKAVELDPKFGIGYQLLAVASRNLGNLDEADKYSKQALTYLDGMTERERYATRGLFYRVTGDYQQCMKEYGEMTARFAGDAIAHNQRALCLSKLRNMREAVEAMRQAVQILPKRATIRGNLAIYAAYAGDFQTADREARAIEEPYDLATLAIAFAQLGQGLLPEAADTYKQLATINARGTSWSASGLGDLALYEGRFSDAARLFEQGAAADLASKSSDRAARKLTSLAYTHLLMGRTGPAVAAAEKALLTSKNIAVQFLAARIFVEAGELAKARTMAEGLAAELPAEPQAYGKIIEGEIALKDGDARQAIKILSDANGILDTWFGHFDLGRAYLEAGGFAQADSEFDRCIGRRGEALSLLVDEEPTYGYFPTAYYYQGRVREGLKSERFAESYREYLNIRGKSTEDPLLPDVRKRAGS